MNVPKVRNSPFLGQDPTFEHYTSPRHIGGPIKGRTHVSTRWRAWISSEHTYCVRGGYTCCINRVASKFHFSPDGFIPQPSVTGYAERCVAVDRCDPDLELSNLPVEVPCHDALSHHLALSYQWDSPVNSQGFGSRACPRGSRSGSCGRATVLNHIAYWHATRPRNRPCSRCHLLPGRVLWSNVPRSTQSFSEPPRCSASFSAGQFLVFWVVGVGLLIHPSQNAEFTRWTPHGICPTEANWASLGGIVDRRIAATRKK